MRHCPRAATLSTENDQRHEPVEIVNKPDSALIARVTAGESITDAAQMTPRYRAEVMRLLAILIDSELAGAAGFVNSLNTAPTLDDRVNVARIISEKFDHARQVLALLGAFGVDPYLYVNEHAWDARLGRPSNLGTRRVGGDKRLNVFHYPIESWTDAATLMLLMGTASTIQLGDQAHSSYQPFAEVIGPIIKRESAHSDEGAASLGRAIAAYGVPDKAQMAVGYWYPRVVDTFGRLESERLETYRAYGLRRQSNADLLDAWRDVIAPRLQTLGLSAPA